MTCVKCGRAGSRGFDGDACKATTVCAKRAAKRPAFVDVELPFGTAADPVCETAYTPTFGTAVAPVFTPLFGEAAAPVYPATLPPWMVA